MNRLFSVRLLFLNGILAAAVLSVAFIISLQVSILLAGATEAAAEDHQRVGKVLDAASATLAKLNEAATETKSTARIVRIAAADQAELYAESSARVFQALGRLLLIEDDIQETLTKARGTMGKAEPALEEMAKAVQQITATAKAAEELVQQPELPAMARNVEAMTANALVISEKQVAIHDDLKATTGAVRDMVTPKKKSFWRKAGDLLMRMAAVAGVEIAVNQF